MQLLASLSHLMSVVAQLRSTHATDDVAATPNKSLAGVAQHAYQDCTPALTLLVQRVHAC